VDELTDGIFELQADHNDTISTLKAAQDQLANVERTVGTLDKSYTKLVLFEQAQDGVAAELARIESALNMSVCEASNPSHTSHILRNRPRQ
jgi:hypothetical protein